MITHIFSTHKLKKFIIKDNNDKVLATTNNIEIALFMQKCFIRFSPENRYSKPVNINYLDNLPDDLPF